MTSNNQLKSIVERIERLESDKAEIASDIKDVYAEAKGNGYDVKALRTIVRMRKQDAADRALQQQMVETYMVALGMLADTPLGGAALDRVGRSKARLSESMKDAAQMAQEMADLGMIDKDAADETSRLAAAVANKFGDGAR